MNDNYFLKPCPVCGITPCKIRAFPTGEMNGRRIWAFYVECRNGGCGVNPRTADYRMKWDAADEWNTRICAKGDARETDGETDTFTDDNQERYRRDENEDA